LGYTGAETARDGAEPVIVGRVFGVHGLSGGVKAKVLSDVPHRFDVGQHLYIRDEPYCIASSAYIPSSQIILKFRGVDSPDAARLLVGELLTVPLASVPSPPEGEYFHFQLLGMRVLTEEGEDLGRVTEILETGSNDVYVVSGDAGQVLIPALVDVIRKVKVDEGLMVVRLLDGLR
jgi:16S rRNA processing protein RimM